MKNRVSKRVTVSGPGGIRFSPQASAYLHGLMDGRIAIALLRRVPKYLQPFARLEENLLVSLPENVPPASTEVVARITEIYAIARVPDDKKPEGQLCDEWAHQPINATVTFWFDGIRIIMPEENHKRT